MNDNIFNLAKKAGLISNFFLVEGSPCPQYLGAEESIKAYDDFAQMLIDQCIEIAIKNPDNVSEAIKEYFNE